ncbi:hypothetical protein NliqN6_3552 [Naganishia liquefaciens]|uniref:Guanosine-3',5'-bis(diphosphate) 3'-pyrophosphohydrolase MESH1 n=1 Tax=Naganishia liquefaciens TaxID=104408 RepID=A0A8H3TUW3_9TREE|nr:hypothetical protein NliqN6_3552 [Naganishia liquefaciens]
MTGLTTFPGTAPRETSATPSDHSATTSDASGARRNMSDAALLLKTATFAAEKHRNQRRKNTEASPYINHPLAVANILSNYGVDHLPTLMAAILHDTVEDTDTTLQEIATLFGDDVASIVEECTDPPNTPVQIRKQLQVDTAPTKSREAQRVKLGDKLHNLYSIREDAPVGWTPRRCQEYFIWARKVTSSCYQALPLIEIAFNDLYENKHFVLNGKIYKCHPDLGEDIVSEEEMVELKRFMGIQKKRKRDGTASPIYY